MERPVTQLLFIEPGCNTCFLLYTSLQANGPVLAVATTAMDGYEPQFLDATEIVTRTFRVTSYPTLIVLRDGQERIRQVDYIDLEIVAATVSALDANRIPRTWRVGIEVGERVPGRLFDFTGLVVYWQEGCGLCGREADQIEELKTIGATKVEVIAPDGTGLGEDTAVLWSLPGSPMHVYLRDGVALWIDTGYREDLVELVRRIAEATSQQGR